MGTYNENRFYKVIMFKCNKPYMLFDNWSELTKHVTNVMGFTAESTEESKKYDCTSLTGHRGRVMFWWHKNIMGLPYTFKK